MSPLLGIVLAAVLLALIAYRRRAIAPGIPRKWRHSHAVAAQLCRRVHRAVDRAAEAVQRAGRAGVPVAWVEQAVGDLRGCATAIDHQLVAAAQLPLSPRHRSLLALRYRIIDLERASTRVVTMVNDAMSPDVDAVQVSIAHVNERLDHLDGARRELRDTH
jgi:hypothetical protein